MKRKLEMDDVVVGMYITVTRGEINELLSSTPEGTILIKKETKYYKGKVLQVLSVDLPYIAVQVLGDVGQVPLDMRVMEFMQTSPEYVKSLHPKSILKESNMFDGLSEEEIKAVDQELTRIVDEKSKG